MKKTVMTYALKNDILTCISDVKSGLECSCICPQCHSVLVAHKGKKNIHHFKHYNSKECETGYQTSLHLLAKEIISNEKRFIIPPVSYSFNYNNKFIDIPETEVTIDKVELEIKTGDIIPDIVLYHGKQILLVEIYVTHKIDEEKLNKIKSLGLSTIEIDLSQTDREISYEDLRNILINTCSEKQWIFNKFVNDNVERLDNVTKIYPVTVRISKYNDVLYHIDNCPKKARNYYGEPFANVKLDCYECEYFIEDTMYNSLYEPESIHCVGQAKIKTLDDLNKYLSKK